MTGGGSSATQSSHHQHRQVSPGLLQQQQMFHDGMMLQQQGERKKSKEIIHSGHFMISDFEAEGHDDDEVAIPVPEDAEDGSGAVLGTMVVSSGVNPAGDLAGNSPVGAGSSAWAKKSDSSTSGVMAVDAVNWVMKHVAGPSTSMEDIQKYQGEDSPSHVVTIDQSLTKLFQCMTLAYSSKLSSPRWKNFKGLRLQWKDKIRLNNLIWRCWHMQFIERRNTAVCQFASPLEVDQHNKPEAVVLEGKYWKRRLATVTAEYKKWRIFFKNHQLMGRTSKDLNDLSVSGELDQLDWFPPRSNCSFNSGSGSLALDDDFFMDFSDTLFTSLSSNQPFPFPNPREIAKGAGLADFIQPGLIQLQPNLDDISFMDTLEPLHELLSGRLPPVEEEISAVEENLVSRLHEMHRRNDYSMQDSTPYSTTATGASSSSSSVVTSVTTTPATSPLLNYHVVDSQSQSDSVYLNSMRFTHAHIQASSSQQQQGPVAHSSNSVVYHFEGPSTSSSYHSSAQGLMQQQQPTTGTFISGNTNIFDHPGSSQPATFQRQSSTGSEHGFVVPTTQFQGKQRSRSRSGSGATSSGTANTPTILPHPGTPLSASQPVIGSSRTNRGKAASTSMSSPARLLNMASPVAQELSIGRNSRGGGGGGRVQRSTTTDLQHIMPGPPAVSPPSSTPRPILPDNGTLLAQLLTGPNLVGAASTTLLLTSTSDASNSRIPLLFPIQNVEAVGAATASASSVVAEKPVTLLPAAFTRDLMHNVTGEQTFKRESTPQPNSVKANQQQQQQQEDVLPSASTTAGAVPVRNSSGKQSSSTADGERAVPYKEHRRVCHINAEQKRRCNIKNGFDMLQSLLPGGSGAGSGSGGSSGSGNSGGGGKSSDVSKAAMLHRGADYIRTLRTERQQQQEELEQLKQNIEVLNTAISGCQALLPANGAPVSRQRSNRMREMFDEWVRVRTLQNWKFWIFSILIQPLLESYCTALSSSTYEDLWQNVLNWVDQFCSLIALRPVVFNSLRNLSKTTDILTNPSRLPAEATQAACNPTSSQPPNNPSST